VKGGHAVEDTGDDAVDVVFDGTATRELRAPRIDTPTTTARVQLRLGTAAGLARARRGEASRPRRRMSCGRSPAARGGGSAAVTARWTTSAGRLP
jgi:hypothetical protein